MRARIYIGKEQKQKEVRKIEIGSNVAVMIKVTPSRGEKNMDKEETQRNHSWAAKKRGKNGESKPEFQKGKNSQ